MVCVSVLESEREGWINRKGEAKVERGRNGKWGGGGGRDEREKDENREELIIVCFFLG